MANTKLSNNLAPPTYSLGHQTVSGNPIKTLQYLQTSLKLKMTQNCCKCMTSWARDSISPTTTKIVLVDWGRDFQVQVWAWTCECQSKSHKKRGLSVRQSTFMLSAQAWTQVWVTTLLKEKSSESKHLWSSRSLKNCCKMHDISRTRTTVTQKQTYTGGVRKRFSSSSLGLNLEIKSTKFRDQPGHKAPPS